MDIADFFTVHEYIVPTEGAAEVTQTGSRFLAEFGIELSPLNSNRREFCRLCLDWTERRAHIAGALGAALTKRCFDLGWIERRQHSSGVIVTLPGQRGFLDTFGIGVPGRNKDHAERLGGSHATGKDTYSAG